MASSTLSCISSAIDDLEFLKDFCHNLERFLEHHSLSVLKGNLVFLRAFLLCARKWGKNVDASLGALLVRIDDAVSQRTQEIHSIRLSTEEDGFSWGDLLDATSDLAEDIRSFNEEINQSCVVFSDCSPGQSSDCVVNRDELLELLDCLLEKLAYFSRYKHVPDLEVVKRTKALAEKLTFLKHLVLFFTMHEVEDGKMGLFFTQAECVAVNVARHIFWCGFLEYRELPMQIKRADYWELLQSVVPVEACKTVIASNCLSKNARSELDEHILRDFVDMLLERFWEILKAGTCLVIHLRNQLQTLYEGLRFLRITLMEKPNKFDEKMRDLTQDVVYEAGLAIFLLSLNATNDHLVKELVSFDLLEKFTDVQAMVAVEFPERLSFNFPRTNELGFVDFLLNYIMDLTGPEAASLALVNCPVQTIQEELSFLRPFLGKIVELHSQDEELQSLWDRIMEVAYKVEFLIDSLLVGYIMHSSSMSFDSILEEIKIIKAEVLNFDSKRIGPKVDEVARKYDHILSQGSKPMINNVVVGFEDEAVSVISRLTSGSCQLRIVPIIGVPGLGKTTLAKKVYSDIAVIYHFRMRAWCTASQVHDKKSLLLEILTSIDVNLPANVRNMSEEVLAHQVKKRLLSNKYLIVLDDVWDIEVWNGLEASFPDDGNGSRVILTSRLRDVAPQDKLDQEPHSLRQLTHDESWDLIKEKFCPGKGIVPLELCELRKEIVELCQGLPLTIVILVGILANMDPPGWKHVVQSLSSSNISCSEQCAAALELSYKHLPDNLKPCFLYFGGFPEDHEHTTERLMWLWVTEGFVQTTHSKTAEYVANDYLMNLISRSLVMVSEQRSIGGIKACRVHDLLYEFCVTKAKEEKLLQFVRGYDELYTLHVPHYLRRLCINSNPGHFEESRLSFPTVRSLLFFELGPREPDAWYDFSFIFQVFKLLRVLDLSQIMLGSSFPTEIEWLVQLRYLAVLGCLKSIPSSIANLSNLETLILEAYAGRISLPDTIWDMKKLRHLQLKDNSFKGGFYLPRKNLDSSSELCNLDTFCTVCLPSWENIDKILKRLPNVRKLKCKLYLHSAEKGDKKILVLDFLSQLKSLNLRLMSVVDMQCQYEFHFSMTIEKLTLSGFRLSWSEMSVVASLHNLKVLKLLQLAFVGEEWSMEEEEFPNLVFLKLDSLDIVKWTAVECENSSPRLKKLVLENCCHLKEIPSSLGKVSTLEMIELSDCPNCASSVEKIKEEQIFSMGYTDLKLMSSSKRVCEY